MGDRTLHTVASDAVTEFILKIKSQLYGRTVAFSDPLLDAAVSFFLSWSAEHASTF